MSNKISGLPEKLIPDSELNLTQEEFELLEKAKCVRCGSKTSGGKGARCSACLKKLSAKRKTPGTKERSWQHADQALRRDRGGAGTTSGGHKTGKGNRQEIQRKMKAAEKKTGSKLSLDRKDNSRGYEAKNTRAVPQSLNRGRHHVDPKKLAAWRKRLKKSELDADQFYTLLKARAIEVYDSDMLELIKALFDDYNTVAQSEAASKLMDVFEEVQELRKGSMHHLAPISSNEQRSVDPHKLAIQEKLGKAVPSFKDVEHPYAMTHSSDPNIGYSGDDQKKAQIRVVKRALSLEGVKNNTRKMINPNTGKEELHVLMHRGIQPENFDPNTTKRNQLTFKDRHVEQLTHAVHTLNPKVAGEYGDVHSFWVPVSHISGANADFDKRYMDPSLWSPSGEDLKEAYKDLSYRNRKIRVHGPEVLRHQGIAHEIVEINHKNVERKARENKSFNPHADFQDHIVVKPGKYIRELKKNNQLPIDKSKFKYKHAKTDATHSHYDVHHDGRLVGQISIDRKNNTPSGGYVQPAFHHLLSHIGDSVKAFHRARNTNTDN